jgi:hypothetical protein
MKKIILVFSLVMLGLIACSQTKRTTFDDMIWGKMGYKFGDGSTLLSAPTWLNLPGVPLVFPPAVHTHTYESALGNPSTSGYVLSSTTAGVRTWIPNGSGGSMVYPGSGIPISTGIAWGTSIVNNSANWNTAFGWGNHVGLYRGATWVPTFAQVTSKPTTLLGYGITDAKPLSYIPTYAEITGKPTLFDGTWTSLTGKPTTFTPVPHTHDYAVDIVNKPPTESLSVALANLPGMKLPRLTQAQISALTPTATDAILVVNITDDALQYWTGTQWVTIVSNK